MFIYILFKGPNGFDELRKFIKHSSDFTKEVASILHERFVTIFYIYIGIVDSDWLMFIVSIEMNIYG